MPSERVHASAQAIEELASSCNRFARAVRATLHAAEAEIPRVQEALEDRQADLRREISDIEDEIASAGEDDDTSSAHRRLEEAEDALASAKRRASALEHAVSSYQMQAAKLYGVVDEDVIRATTFLREANARLLAYQRYALDGALPRWLADNFGAGRDQSHLDVRRAIKEANVRSAERRDGGVNEAWVLTNGVSIWFKPSDGEDTASLPRGVPPRTLYRREVAASLLDEALGSGLVPPTEEFSRDGRIGSGQLFLGSDFRDADYLIQTGELDFSAPAQALSNRQRQDWQLFDSLIATSDRHPGNWKLRRRKDGTFDLALIDNGHSFSESHDPPLFLAPAAGEPIDDVAKARLLHLLATEDAWRAPIEKLIGSDATDRVLVRARSLLARERWPSKPDVI